MVHFHFDFNIKSIDGNYKPDTEIILVDNGSTDDTPAVLLEGLKSVSNALIRSVRVENNIGYGECASIKKTMPAIINKLFKKSSFIYN